MKRLQQLIYYLYVVIVNGIDAILTHRKLVLISKDSPKGFKNRTPYPIYIGYGLVIIIPTGNILKLRDSVSCS